jgi:hypothetical protein
MSPMENSGLNIEMLNDEVCDSYSYRCYCISARGVTQTISMHYDCVFDTQWSCFCYTDVVTKYVQYMQAPSVEVIRNF